MNVLIIGCGLIGRKRAYALSFEDKLVACCDVNEATGKKFANDFKCDYYKDYRNAIVESNADIVVISVVNKFMLEIVKNALDNGKHILVEKPLGRNFDEANEMVKYYYEKLKMFPKLKFKVGFNHRFHPAIEKAFSLIQEETIGKVLTIRARYGHGGRKGMEKEWRASKDLCGGGELLDQGVHIIDLIRWFGGEIKSVFGTVETKYWDMEVEDNAFAILKTKEGIIANFNVSWTNWKNVFSFEVFGEKGYLLIDGLGGSYGLEKLEIGIKRPEGGRPLVTITEFPPEDISWMNEWKEFIEAIKNDRDVVGDYIDGLNANRVISAIYLSNTKREMVEIE